MFVELRSSHGANTRLRSWVLQAVTTSAARLSAPAAADEPAIAALGFQPLSRRPLGMRRSSLGRPQPRWRRIRNTSTCLVARRRPSRQPHPCVSLTYPNSGRRVSELDGLLARARSHAIYIGTFTWGGRKGSVVLAPDFPAGGEQGNHLIFRWRKSGTDFALGLHGWEPLSRSFATLRQMVISI
jgi:hypothetical protein